MANKKEIIINASLAEEVRIAILENGRLIDLDIETSIKAKHKGNIYKGIISNIEDGLEAAFVEIGEEKQAFLPLSEVRPAMYPAHLQGKHRVKASEVLSRGQEVVVQVTKDEIGNKGAAVSSYLSLPGRFVVLMHSDESGGGISRKIDSEQARSAAREMLSRLSVPEHMAVIIRTAGMNATASDLFRDFKTLCQSWQQIDKGAQLGRAPTLLYREPDIIIRTVRDYLSSDVNRIVIDDEEEFEEALSYFKEHMPDSVHLLERHRKRDPIFQYFGIEKALSELFDLGVKLPSGGHLTIEQTEALVAIDVNSGSSTKEEDHEATVYKTNLEAADEIARQLRIRDLGGIVVIDFIDMASRWHKREVERRLRELMVRDKARVKLGGISENGTLELTRQRIRQSHSQISMIKCTSCKGTGRVRDAQGLSTAAFRRIGGYLAKKRIPLAKVIVRIPIDVANFLNNTKRKDLIILGENYETQIDIIGDNRLFDEQIEFSEERRGFLGLKAKSSSREFWGKSEGALSKTTGRSGAKSIKKDFEQGSFPAPTIGPAPVLIEFDERELEKSQASEAKKESQQSHFDDELTEALFGRAPEQSFQELVHEIAPNSVMEKEVVKIPTETKTKESNVLSEKNTKVNYSSRKKKLYKNTKKTKSEDNTSKEIS